MAVIDPTKNTEIPGTRRYKLVDIPPLVMPCTESQGDAIQAMLTMLIRYHLNLDAGGHARDVLEDQWKNWKTEMTKHNGAYKGHAEREH